MFLAAGLLYLFLIYLRVLKIFCRFLSNAFQHNDIMYFLSINLLMSNRPWLTDFLILIYLWIPGINLLGHCIYFYLGSSFLLIHLCFLNGLLRFLNTLDFSLWCLHLLQIHTSKPRLVSPLFLHVAFLPVFLLMSYAFSRCL